MPPLATRFRKSIDPLIRNENSKRVFAALGIRKTFARQEKTGHYRMPVLEEHGGYRVIKPYSGPEIPASEWTGLEYMTYPTDPSTFFAPLTSATGENILRGFWDFGKPDLDGIWTPNAERCPTLVNYVKSIQNRYGRVQLIRMEPGPAQRPAALPCHAAGDTRNELLQRFGACIDWDTSQRFQRRRSSHVTPRSRRPSTPRSPAQRVRLPTGSPRRCRSGPVRTERSGVALESQDALRRRGHQPGHAALVAARRRQALVSLE